MTAASTNAYTSAHAVTRSTAVGVGENGDSIAIATLGLSGRTQLLHVIQRLLPVMYTLIPQLALMRTWTEKDDNDVTAS